jgi:hypothetical protein
MSAAVVRLSECPAGVPCRSALPECPAGVTCRGDLPEWLLAGEGLPPG